MAPASLTHGLLQAELAYLLLRHLRAAGSECRVVVAPGVIPRVESQHNERVPDLAVTCSMQPDGRTIADPVLLIEIISPSNEADTRRNVWAYTTIPSVFEILLLSSTSMVGELLRRDTSGAWPIAPVPLIESSLVRLDSIGFVASMGDFYAATRLAG